MTLQGLCRADRPTEPGSKAPLAVRHGESPSVSSVSDFTPSRRLTVCLPACLLHAPPV